MSEVRKQVVTEVLPLNGTSYKYSERAMLLYQKLDTFAVCVPGDIFSRGAQSFAELNKSDEMKTRVDTHVNMMHLFSKICELALKSAQVRTSKENRDGKPFPRFDVKIVRIPVQGDHEKTAAIILFFAYADCIDDEEDAQCASELMLVPDRKEGGQDEYRLEQIRKKYDNKKKERRKHEDPIHALHWMIVRNEGGHDVDEMGRPKRLHQLSKEEKKAQRDIDKITKLDLARIIGSYTSPTDRRTINSRYIYEKDDPKRDSDRVNPINPYEACSIAVACQKAMNLGGDYNYCKPESYRGELHFGEDPRVENGITMYPEDGNVTIVSLGECLFESLMRLRFYWLVDPLDVEEDPDELAKLAQLYFDSDERMKEKFGPGYALHKAREQAMRSLRLARIGKKAGMTVADLRAQVDKWKKDELDPLRAEKTDERRAALASKKTEIQFRALQAATTVIHPKGNMPEGLQKIALHFETMIEKSKNKNPCIPVPRNFTNLTTWGNYMAYLSLCLESILGVATLHRECIMATIAEYELYYGRNFHVNCGFIGEAMSGKSFILWFRRWASVMGTRLRIDAMTEGFFKTSDTSGFNYKIWDTEEMQPSIFGVDKHNTDKSGNAQNDKSTSLRNIMTSGTYGCVRLERTDDGNGFKAVMIQNEVQTTFTFAMNPLRRGYFDIARNMFSRVSPHRTDKTERPDGSVQGKIIAVDSTSARNSVAKDKFLIRMQRDHCMMAMHQTLIRTGALDPVTTTTTDHFLVDFLGRLVKAGLPEAADIRHFEQERALISTVCLFRGIVEYCDSEIPGFKDITEPWSDTDWIRLNKLAHTSVEDLVFVMTLMCDKYEDPMLCNTADALCKYMGVKPMPMHTRVQQGNWMQQEQRRRRNVEKQSQGKQKKKPSADGHIESEWKDGDKPVAESKFAATTQADLELTYNVTKWVDRKLRMEDTDRCDQLASEIYHAMRKKPAINHLCGLLCSLLQTRTPDKVNPTEMIPVMKFVTVGANNDMRVCVAKSFMQGTEANRLVIELAKMLNGYGMPDIEYITGMSDSTYPWILQTIIPAQVEFDRKMEEKKEIVADEVRNQMDEKRKKDTEGFKNHAYVDSLVNDIVTRCAVYDPTAVNDDDFYANSFAPPPEKKINFSNDYEEHGTVKHFHDTDTTFLELVALGFGIDENAVWKLFSRAQRYKMRDKRLAIDWFYPTGFSSIGKKKRPKPRGKTTKISPLAEADARGYFAGTDDAEMLAAAEGGEDRKHVESKDEPEEEEEEMVGSIEDETSRMMQMVKSGFRGTKRYMEYKERELNKKQKTSDRGTTLMKRGEGLSFVMTPLNRSRPMILPPLEDPSPSPYFSESSASSMSLDSYQDAGERTPMSTGMDPDETTLSGFEEDGEDRASLYFGSRR
jgi:hypothetical protein